MESTDAAELIAELKEERSEHREEERFNRGAALLIATMAAVLAVGGLGGGKWLSGSASYEPCSQPCHSAGTRLASLAPL